MKFPNLHIVWTEGKNLSLPDLLSRSITPHHPTTVTPEPDAEFHDLPPNLRFFRKPPTSANGTECFYRVKTDFDESPDQKSWNDKHHDVFLKYKEQNYQVDLTRNQIRPTTDLRVKELMKNSKPLSFPMKDFKSNYPLITKEDITIGRNITGPTFL